MVTSSRLMMTLAILAINSSTVAFGQALQVVDRADQQSGVVQASDPSERYFREDPAEDGRSKLFRTAAGSATRVSPEQPASFSRPLSVRVLPDTPQGDPSFGMQDPFVPAPHPADQQDIESSRIDEIITRRYQKPVTVRVIQALSGSQAAELFSEVSHTIDERALEPPSYDARVRRALRNLIIALDNEAFLTSLELSSDSFPLDGFRNTLSRLMAAGRVESHEDARRVLNIVMEEADAEARLPPGLAGFEFANASLDTVNKYSGLDAVDPSLRNESTSDSQRNIGLEEQIVGIGVEVREHADGLTVVKPLRGGPAAEAGIQPGDIIVNINGRDIRGMKIDNSVDLLKGSSGSLMKIRIRRESGGDRDISLTCRTVRVWTVNDAKILSGTDIGYFSLSRFSPSSTVEMDRTLDRLHRDGMKSLIIDLRGNPGGLLTTCVEICDRFVACGTIVSTRGRMNYDNLIQEATYSKTWSVPVVVLIDGDSASASEIFAAAIQENRRGMIVGTRSYGKGSVQTHFPLRSIEGDLRVTTALFYSPNGRRMHGAGVTPDVKIEDPDGVLNGDEVLAEAERIAQSQALMEMTKAAGVCGSRSHSTASISTWDGIVDPIHPGTLIR